METTTDTAELSAEQNAAHTRREYIAGLRELADLLDRELDIPLPYNGQHPSPWNRLSIYVTTLDEDDAKRLMRLVSKRVRGKKEKNHRDEYLDLDFSLRGLHMSVTARREVVCRRVETEEVVTKTVPVYATEPIGEKEVTETVRHVEWVCDEGSIMAGASS